MGVLHLDLPPPHLQGLSLFNFKMPFSSPLHEVLRAVHLEVGPPGHLSDLGQATPGREERNRVDRHAARGRRRANQFLRIPVHHQDNTSSKFEECPTFFPEGSAKRDW